MTFSRAKWAKDAQKYDFIKEPDGSIVRVKKKKNNLIGNEAVKAWHDEKAADRARARQILDAHRDEIERFLAKKRGCGEKA